MNEDSSIPLLPLSTSTKTTLSPQTVVSLKVCIISVVGPRLLGQMEPDPDEQEFPGEEELDWDEETANQFKGKTANQIMFKHHLANQFKDKTRSAMSSENFFVLYANNKNTDQPAQSDQHLCCLLCRLINIVALP